MIVPVQLSLYIKDLFIFKILLLKNTHPLTQFAPFFKNLFFLLSFLFHPLLRYFDSSPYPHATPTCPNPIHQLSLHIINGFKQISRGWLYQFNHCFTSKINFWFLKSLYIRLFYFIGNFQKRCSTICGLNPVLIYLWKVLKNSFLKLNFLKDIFQGFWLQLLQ